MATHLFEHRSGHPQSRAAWLGSFLVHAGLLLVLGYVSWTTLGRGSHPHKPDESAMILGLADGAAGETVRTGAGEADSESALAFAEQSPSIGAGAGDLGGDGAMQPVAALDEPTAPLAPPPRLPLLALASPGAASVAAPSAASTPPVGDRFGQLAERATVTVFGARGEGSRFVYLFDHSTSMMGAPLAAAKQQLIASLDALNSGHQFQVIFFNHETQAWDVTGGQQRIPFASEANKQLAAQFIHTVVAVGGTDRLGPLRHALAMNVDVVFFLTDADDAMPEYDVADVIDRAQRAGTAIACIEFGEGAAPGEGGNFLTRLADATGGDYVYVDVTKLGR